MAPLTDNHQSDKSKNRSSVICIRCCEDEYLQHQLHINMASQVHAAQESCRRCQTTSINYLFSYVFNAWCRINVNMLSDLSAAAAAASASNASACRFSGVFPANLELLPTNAIMAAQSHVGDMELHNAEKRKAGTRLRWMVDCFFPPLDYKFQPSASSLQPPALPHLPLKQPFRSCPCPFPPAGH